MLLFSIGVIRDESIEKAILSFIQQHKGQNVEASFILDGVTIPNDIPDRTVEWMYCSGKYIGRNSFDDVYDGHIILFGYNSNRIACKPISNGDSVSSWDIK